MSKSIKSLLLVAAFVISGISHSLAQAPTGILSADISSTTAPVYDLTTPSSGLPYQLNQTIVGVGGTPINLSFGVTISQGVQGQLRNVNNFLIVSIDNNTVAALYFSAAEC
jgi:hypothetical protein